MPNLIQIDNNQTRYLRINYDLGNLCNYKCWYCFPGSNEGTTKWPEVEVVKKNIASLVNYYLDSGIVDRVHIGLLGGEPTLWKHLGEFVEYVSQNSKCKIYILTNGSRTLRWWDEYGHYFGNVNISVHHASADIDHIINVAELLHKKNVSFFTDVLMDHTAWDKCVSIVDQLVSTDTQFMVTAKPVQVDGKTFYTAEQQEYLRVHLKRKPAVISPELLTTNVIKATFDDASVLTTENEHYFMLHGLNHFKGWQCDLGINFLFIDRQGRVSGTCQHKLYGADKYYNVNDVNFNFTPDIKPVICEKDSCNCAGETALPKRKVWLIKQ